MHLAQHPAHGKHSICIKDSTTGSRKFCVFPLSVKTSPYYQIKKQKTKNKSPAWSTKSYGVRPLAGCLLLPPASYSGAVRKVRDAYVALKAPWVTVVLNPNVKDALVSSYLLE